VSKGLIRFARRLSSWDEGTSDEQLIAVEFKDRDSGGRDLKPSVYEIEEHEIVRAFSEHATRFEPPKSAAGIDVSRTRGTVRVTPGLTDFSFTAATHREVVLKDEYELLALVREVRAGLPDRRHLVSVEERRAYVLSQLGAGDQEWVRAREKPTAPKWLKKLNV
jgi:hypothetical protein